MVAMNTFHGVRFEGLLALHVAKPVSQPELAYTGWPTRCCCCQWLCNLCRRQWVRSHARVLEPLHNDCTLTVQMARACEVLH